MSKQNAFLKNYGRSLILLGGIAVGCILGLTFKEKAVVFKPFGDVFLNLLFTIVVPLVFFSLSSTVATMSDLKRLSRILIWMLVVFIATGIIACFFMIAAVGFYPPAEGVNIALPAHVDTQPQNISDTVIKAFTVSDFADLFSKKNMLAMIVFSLLLGIVASGTGPKARAFIDFLVAGNKVMEKMISYIMLYAPVGLGAYFAYLVGVFGPQLLGSYVRAVGLYYPVAFFYFFFAFTIYAYMAGGMNGIKIFWKNITPVALISWGTGSSIASIPANMEAAKRMGVPEDLREVIIPIGGATLHLEGSCLSAILKIALLFGLFHMPFTSPVTIATAIGIALLSGTVMSGIPGGGFLGELLIVTMYGFPVQALPIISMVGTLVDPPATMVNATGDSICCMLTARILNGKNWMLDGKNDSLLRKTN
jgi:Na+/H+-dicarboxylate symporter